MAVATERWRPRTLAQFGPAPHRNIAENVVQSHLAGTPMADAVLLHGPPGTGKTTLARCLAHDYDLALIDINASERADLGALRAASVTDAVGGTGKLLLVDEADALTKRQQRELHTIAQDSRHPVMILCNDHRSLSKPLRRACIEVEVPAPSTADKERVARAVSSAMSLAPPSDETIRKARTYRELLAALERGGTLPPRGDVADMDNVARVRAHLEGEDVRLKTTDYSWLPVWVADHSDGPQPILADVWWARYRRMGKAAEKYLLKATHGVTERAGWPWSLKVKGKAEPEQRPSDDDTEGVSAWL